jgi:hypothetical protein
MVLAEPWPLCPAELLLSTFRGAWTVELHKPPPTPDMASAPLQPVVAVIQHRPTAEAEGKASELAPVKMAFKPSMAGPDAQQMRTIVNVGTTFPTSLMLHVGFPLHVLPFQTTRLRLMANLLSTP